MAEERNRKLLVVEDEIYLQRQIKAILTERGYEVETASSRAEAVQYLSLIHICTMRSARQSTATS